MKTKKKALGKIHIDGQRCKGCLLCIEVCPQKCLIVSETINQSGHHPVEFRIEEACTGCGLCYQICPEVCIEVYKAGAK